MFVGKQYPLTFSDVRTMDSFTPLTIKIYTLNAELIVPLLQALFREKKKYLL